MDRSDTSYIFKICAYDDNCSKRDSAFLNIEIFIRDKSNRKPFFSKANPDSVYIREGEVDSFIVTLYDTIRYNLNKYKHIQLVPDLSDFASVQINGGSILHYNNLEGLDSLKVKFTWAPNCNNIRTEPYRLYLKAYDEGCPRLIRNDTIYVFVQRPMNTEPVFLDQNNNQISIVDTTIFAGDVFKYKFFAIDTNQRFDSVYISLDKSTEISDPTKVSNVVENVSTNAKRKAYSELIWKTTCSDTRSEAYIADIIARDNECKNPKQSILKFKITVKDRPNYLPQFPFSNQSVTVDTIYAGELFTFNLSAVDSNAAGLLTLDTIYTNIPSDLIKPSFDKVSGDNGDTLKSKLIWNTDCSLIRDEPYFIKLGAWIGPCTNPQDTAFHILKLYISKNPALNPKFISGSDTTITLIVGDKYSLDLNAASQIEGGSIEITSKSMIYNNIPGNLAVFEQYGNGKATFSWETSCEHIRDSSYIVYFYASNPICKTNEAGFKVKFNVLPKSDFISPLPNAFSPNGDHINDTYSIYKQYIVTCDPGFRFIVYNRWGKIVFESTNPEFEWDAEGLGAGTYFYTLESRARSQNGTIDIIK